MDCDAGSYCATAYGTGTWACWSEGCSIGRPLLAEGGAARRAPAAPRDDWSAALEDVDTQDLAPELRAALAARWAAVAALEHASIASFARFSLELLALGAPSSLLAEAQQAAADEIEHARIAYALASAYAGRPVGPGPLDVSGVAARCDRTAMLVGLAEEACVGETLGVAEARVLAATVEAPALRRLFARIADDEERHAALAWKTLRWGLEGAGDDVRAAVAAAFDRAIAAASRVASPDGSSDARPESPADGLLAAADIEDIRRRAVAEVVRPCADAVLGATLARA